jgi:NAD(P)-dependent dehydrogenase (short-subunit alcohol dehydrogenase family)
LIYTTQVAVKQMLAQKTGGSIVSITSSLVDHPLAALTASVPMITKGGIDMGAIAEARDIAAAVLYLTEARQVTGEILHVDGGAHLGRW